MVDRLQALVEETLRSGALTQKNLRHAEQEAARSGRTLDAVLLDTGALPRSGFFEALAAVAGIPSFDVARDRIRYSDAQLIPRHVAEQRRLLAVDRHNGRLVVAMVDPEDAFALQQVSSLAGMEVDARVAWEPDLAEAIERAYSVKVDRITADTPHGAAAAEAKPRGEGSRFVVASNEPRRDEAMKMGTVHDPRPSRSLSLGLVSAPAPAPVVRPAGTDVPAVASVLEALARPGEPAEWLGRVATAARDLCQAEAALLYRLEPGQGALEVAAAAGLPGERWRSALVALNEKSLPGWAFVDRKDLLTNEAVHDPHADPALQEALGLRVRSTVCCPVAWEGRGVGLLQVANRPAGFQEEHRALVRALAAQAALVLVAWRALDSMRGLQSRVIEGLRTIGDMSGSLVRSHGELVGRMAGAVGREAGCSEAEVEMLRRSGFLHDLGCLGGKPEHPARGATLLESTGVLADLAPAVRHHHDRWDGTGPPGTLKGEAIPRLARILAVAEAWVETLERQGVARRSQVLADMVADFGTRFDPALKIPFQIAAEQVTPGGPLG